MSIHKELKRQAYEANLEIPRQKLAIYTFGNVSAFDPALGVFAIKPSGIDYADLKAEDMVVVDLQARTVEGSLRASSDTKTHAVLYAAFPKLGGICHTHSMYGVAWAQAQRAIPIFGTTHADHLTTSVPLTEYISDEAVRRDYEEETGRLIVQRMQGISPQEVEMILVAGHGPFTWGKDAMKAVYNARVLEELAQMAYLTEHINPRAPVLSDALIRKHYERKHGAGAYYGQDQTDASAGQPPHP